MTVAKDATGFKKDLEAFAKTVELDLALVLQKITLDLLGKVVRLTPVDTGRARANWQIGDGTPPSGVIDVQEGTAETAKGFEQAAGISFRPFGVYWITNNLPYIKVLEFGQYPQPVQRGSFDRRSGTYVVKSVEGYSRQAPAGMVRVSLAEIAAELSVVGS